MSNQNEVTTWTEAKDKNLDQLRADRQKAIYDTDKWNALNIEIGELLEVKLAWFQAKRRRDLAFYGPSFTTYSPPNLGKEHQTALDKARDTKLKEISRPLNEVIEEIIQEEILIELVALKERLLDVKSEDPSRTPTTFEEKLAALKDEEAVKHEDRIDRMVNALVDIIVFSDFSEGQGPEVALHIEEYRERYYFQTKLIVVRELLQDRPIGYIPENDLGDDYTSDVMRRVRSKSAWLRAFPDSLILGTILRDIVIGLQTAGRISPEMAENILSGTTRPVVASATSIGVDRDIHMFMEQLEQRLRGVGTEGDLSASLVAQVTPGKPGNLVAVTAKMAESETEADVAQGLSLFPLFGTTPEELRIKEREQSPFTISETGVTPSDKSIVTEFLDEKAISPTLESDPTRKQALKDVIATLVTNISLERGRLRETDPSITDDDLAEGLFFFLSNWTEILLTSKVRNRTLEIQEEADTKTRLADEAKLQTAKGLTAALNDILIRLDLRPTDIPEDRRTQAMGWIRDDGIESATGRIDRAKAVWLKEAEAVPVPTTEAQAKTLRGTGLLNAGLRPEDLTPDDAFTVLGWFWVNPAEAQKAVFQFAKTFEQNRAIYDVAGQDEAEKAVKKWLFDKGYKWEDLPEVWLDDVVLNVSKSGTGVLDFTNEELDALERFQINLEFTGGSGPQTIEGVIKEAGIGALPPPTSPLGVTAKDVATAITPGVTEILAGMPFATEQQREAAVWEATGFITDDPSEARLRAERPFDQVPIEEFEEVFGPVPEDQRLAMVGPEEQRRAGLPPEVLTLEEQQWKLPLPPSGLSPFLTPAGKEDYSNLLPSFAEAEEWFRDLAGGDLDLQRVYSDYWTKLAETGNQSFVAEAQAQAIARREQARRGFPLGAEVKPLTTALEYFRDKQAPEILRQFEASPFAQQRTQLAAEQEEQAELGQRRRLLQRRTPIIRSPFR